MPTEKRSSNPEQMIAMPREWVENYAGLLEERCAYEASERVQALLDQPAALHQGEPVSPAFVMPSNENSYGFGYVDGTCIQSLRGYRDHLEGIVDSIPEVPLYTRPDAGGVDQVRYKAELYDEVWQLATGLGYMNVTTAISALRTELESVKSSRDAFAQNAIDLRDQLAERDALLREIADHCNGCVMPTEQLIRDWGSSIDDALSASAEPKSCGACPGCTDGCQLEKDSPPSTTAGQDERAAIELAAQTIYETWSGQPGYVPWQPGGNSERQSDARLIARRTAAKHGNG